MQKSLAFLMFFLGTMKISAQAVTDFDCVVRNEIYLLKTDSDIKGALNAESASITSNKKAEQYFGPNYKSRKYYNNMTRQNYSELDYGDGLQLTFPDNPGNMPVFEVTTDKYTLYLKDGRTIKVGMKGEDLKAIFPKSYSKRRALSEYEQKMGIVKLTVYFYHIQDNKKVIDLAWITFVLNSEKGVLEKFFTFAPE